MKYLKRFQKQHGLYPDGIIGTNTLNKFKEVLKLGTNEATAHFVGQLAHETATFKYGEENLNYSSKALLKTFRKYFPTFESTKDYARRPERIANKVYANRMGNGNEMSGDGWRYKGRGAIQITGKNNYTSLANDVDRNILINPCLLLDQYYFECAIWFFQKNNLFRHCLKVDESSIKKLTRAINGGYNGLDHRRDLTNQFYRLLTR